MSERVTVAMIDGVADVRLNRPDKRNALDREMFVSLVETADRLAKDPALRCVVLSGEGPSFCAGLDFASFQGMADSEAGDPPAIDLGATQDGRITHFAQQACFGWTELPVPVIGAIQGHALGGGIQLALSCDIRFVAPGTKMSVLEIRWGLIPDMTGTQSLVNLVGLDVAKELTFTGRMVEASEAVELGLATHLAEHPREQALELAADIAQKSPHAIRAAKRLFNDAPKLTVAEGFAAERQEIGRLIGSPNQVESVKAFFEKRPPSYRDASQP